MNTSVTLSNELYSRMVRFIEDTHESLIDNVVNGDATPEDEELLDEAADIIKEIRSMPTGWF